MNKQREMNYAMIEAAVDKGIRDIQENTSRGIRNLVDLGLHLSTGRFQKDIFRIARQMLHEERSAYYALAGHIVQSVDARIIKRFGINLGYNSWTYGAGLIREFEKQNKFNIPWTLVFDLCDYGLDMSGQNGAWPPIELSMNRISDLLAEGEKTGIYNAMFFTDIRTLDPLLINLTCHQDSSYVLFSDPAAITDERAGVIAESGHIAVVLAMDTAVKQDDCVRAAAVLRNNGCLYGASYRYGDENAAYVMSENFLDLIESLQCSFAFIIRDHLNDADQVQKIGRFIRSLRQDSCYPFLLFDFYEDLAYVDRIISIEDCFMAIKANGRIAVGCLDNLADDLNACKENLTEILQATMPRIQYLTQCP
ncbi:MAG: hypothetical protein VB070_10330 [Clostridiaceae bacterium]|nr:hypothetical protein [Clostridiaceae bacterium]